MASLTKETARSGKVGWRIVWTDSEGKQKALRLGQIPRRAAERMLILTERLLEARRLGLPLDSETARWAEDLDDTMRERLARLGLVSPNEKTVSSLQRFLEDYVSRRPDVAERTLLNWKKTITRLIKFFGPDRDIASIGPGEARDWAYWLRTPEARLMRYAGKTQAEGLQENTARRMVGVARQFFADAKRRRLISENPFEGIPAGTGPNTEREYFVTREETERLLEVIPHTEWKLLVALARYGGLRVPSEALELRWQDIDWERRRMVVRSPKTRRKGYGARVIPIFPELAPLLERAWEEAPTGAEYVINWYRSTEANLRTQLTRYILRAGLLPWPKLWVSMRQSRAIELAREFPSHVATAWCGHSTQVAMRHYWRVTDADFERASNPDSVGSVEPDSGVKKSVKVNVRTELQAVESCSPAP
ncbi:MAG TPA: site-specific integrase, partial [Thermoguttaceae bacterium]|nr:site-specific integrase [Thermoguttaceae bacterium]